MLWAALTASAAGLYVLFTYIRRVAGTLDRDCWDSTSAASFEDPHSATRLPVPSIHSDASKVLTVVFPAYNESARMGAAIDEAIEFLTVKRKRDRNFTYELIVVDDGSTDDTYQRALKFTQRLGIDTFRVLRFAANRGKGAAVRAGVLAARGQTILFADSDGATQFSDFDSLNTRLKEIAASPTKSENSSLFSSIAGQHGLVAGSRAHLERSEVVAKRRWYRNVMMRGFHALVTMVAGKQVRDTQCGFKVCCCTSTLVHAV